ncbi:NAD(P)/FAD-dependent oxidoreductase [Govanella unica]|uniref:Ferredoxin--NADP reductase n=1 Tax=Govanella unica TaxID=2975056 RepID=A0A9X3Z898_9PROT|nr:NAD(P)/FAD-dependent oxidoreductase [Govania unica]MDA5195105.1 NAD(P)/FAD-dependent oxidoreductase [Govania unica]
MSEDVLSTDAIIIGAGPVGLFAVFELGLLGLKCHLVDNLDRPGGQCTQLYPEKPIFDIPSRPRCTGQELTDDLVLQAQPFEPVYHFKQQAETLRRLDDGRWLVTCFGGLEIAAPIVVIAAGAGSFVPKRPPLDHVEDYENGGVHYAVRRMEEFRGKRLVIAGGGDSALDWVLNLAPLAAELTLVHRREEFRAAPDSVGHMLALVAAGQMRLIIGSVRELIGEGGTLHALGVQHKDGATETISCDAFLPFFGLKINLGPLADWGFAFDAHHRILVDPVTYEAGLPGVYAVGDMCTYGGKLKLILSGFHEAAVMAHAAFHHARPNEKMVTGYTTTNTELQRRLGVGV